MFLATKTDLLPPRSWKSWLLAKHVQDWLQLHSNREQQHQPVQWPEHWDTSLLGGSRGINTATKRQKGF